MTRYPPAPIPVPGSAYYNGYMGIPTLPDGVTRKDSDKEEDNMWKTALDVSEDDKWMIDAWIEDANGILAFTGLLSATIGAFIIEFYKTLSPDSGDQTVDLLGQISQQLTNSNTRNGATITAAVDQPFSPSKQMIWVNGMWLISLVFSLSSALITSLNQQAVRRYIEMLKDSDPTKANDHARVRLLLFRGIKFYKMPLAILAAPTLLHLSILLFVGGLVIVFHTIFEKVAIAVDVAAGVSGLVYLAMSLLPLLDLKCPYRTPITYMLMYLWVAFRFSVKYCGLLPFAKRLPWCPCLCPCPCTCIDSDGLDGAGSGEQYLLPGSSYSLEKPGEEQRRHLTDGFRENVINDATNPQEHEDRKTITWLFRRLSLGDKNKFLLFAASIPRNKVVDLIQPIKSGKIALRQPLEALLRSCTGNAGAGDPGEHVRRSALLVYLTAIYDIAKAPSIPNLNLMRDKLANIGLMRGLRNDSDDSIRITSRSICALVARQVFGKRRLKDADLSWLEEVTGEPSNTIREADDTTRTLMNLKSFAYGVPPNYSNHLSTEDVRSFRETLAILLDVGTENVTTADLQPQLSEAVRQIQQHDPDGGRDVLGSLQSVFPSLSAPPQVYQRPIPRGDDEVYIPPEPSYVTSTPSIGSRIRSLFPSLSGHTQVYQPPIPGDDDEIYIPPEPSYSTRTPGILGSSRPPSMAPVTVPGPQVASQQPPPPIFVHRDPPSQPPPGQLGRTPSVYPDARIHRGTPQVSVQPSRPAPSSGRGTLRHREAPPPHVIPSPQPTPPPRAPSEPPSHPVPPSPVVRSLPTHRLRRPTRSSQVIPLETPSRRAPPPSSFPSQTTISSAPVFPSPTTISSPPRQPSPLRPPSRRRRPPADPSPSTGAVPPSGVPPTSHIASPPPPHTNRRSYTAHPPHEPI